jgi:hypothetical protein
VERRLINDLKRFHFCSCFPRVTRRPRVIATFEAGRRKARTRGRQEESKRAHEGGRKRASAHTSETVVESYLLPLGDKYAREACAYLVHALTTTNWEVAGSHESAAHHSTQLVVAPTLLCSACIISLCRSYVSCMCSVCTARFHQIAHEPRCRSKPIQIFHLMFPKGW